MSDSNGTLQDIPTPLSVKRVRDRQEAIDSRMMRLEKRSLKFWIGIAVTLVSAAGGMIAYGARGQKAADDKADAAEVRSLEIDYAAHKAHTDEQIEELMRTTRRIEDTGRRTEDDVKRIMDHLLQPAWKSNRNR